MTGRESLIFEKDAIYIDETKNLGEAVMHNAEDLIMKECANLATINGGHILEIGFGMGISASYIQQNNIKSHTIIEVHPEIYKRASDWANSKNNVNIILGNWYDVLPTIYDKFDGIFHDTHRDFQIHLFLDRIKKNCNDNCSVVFFTYPMDTKIFSSKLVSVNNDDFNRLPYRKNNYFRNNMYEIKYTNFKNGKFTKTHLSNKLI